MDNINLLGYLAALVTTGMSLPQLVKIVRTKHAGDVSIIMFIMSFVGTILWFSYGVLIESTPIIIANLVGFFIVGPIIYLKLKYDKRLS